MSSGGGKALQKKKAVLCPAGDTATPTADAAIARGRPGTAAEETVRRQKAYTTEYIPSGRRIHAGKQSRAVLRGCSKESGRLALKFTSQSMNGVPDRLVLLPAGRLRLWS